MGAETIQGRAEALRNLMRERGIAAYLVPSTDAHQSEYVPAWWRRREWISGFTGSAGDVVITLNEAWLWTDSRYYLQASEQLEGSGFQLMKSGMPDVPKISEWLATSLQRGDRVGFDPEVLSRKMHTDLEEDLSRRGIELLPVEGNLIDAIWTDRPAVSNRSVRVLEEIYAGEPVGDKLDRVREKMKEMGADVHILSSLDGIAWLFNLRGEDVDYNPVFLSHAAVTSESAFLFIDEQKVSESVRSTVSGLFELRPYDAISEFVDNCESDGQVVWADPEATSHTLTPKTGVHQRSPVIDLKAAKNPVELNGFRKCHIEDGVAMIAFIRWLEEQVPGGQLTEMSAARQLLSFREEREGFMGASFNTISSYGPHAAINHYSVTDASNIPLGSDSLYLVDSGGQYQCGTTDITRTFCFGQPIDEQIEMYTRVIRGHIALATLAFPEGTFGKQLDLAARKPLWEVGKNYGHGTGHGIGHYLNVHEGPVSISPRGNDVALAVGNVISNEPGYYDEGSYGIRIENLLAVVPDSELSRNGQSFLKFENLTRCPIATNLIDVALLDEDERTWINDYHRVVEEALSPHLDEPGRRWLEERTRPI
jgi:Xaa-Pro aminopeptidase